VRSVHLLHSAPQLPHQASELHLRSEPRPHLEEEPRLLEAGPPLAVHLHSVLLLLLQPRLHSVHLLVAVAVVVYSALLLQSIEIFAFLKSFKLK
jgi:hypothetical protein